MTYHSGMFLRKITKLRAFGRFRNASIKGGEYDKLTLFYGGNGRGKTTVCAMMRSLSNGEANLIMERRAFGASSPPELEVLLEDGIARFDGAAWSRTCPDIHIFDGHFINESIHGGYRIETDHRRNFYRIVVGEAGVKLAQELDELDRQATNKQSEVTTQKRIVEQRVPKGYNLEQFLALESEDDIETKRSALEKQLKAANDAAAIAQRPLPPLPTVPEPPSNLEAVLTKTLDDVSTDAAQRVQAQIERHKLFKHGERWLSHGLQHIAEDECPFCGQDIQESQLIDAYRAYFSDAYAQLRRDIEELSSAVDQSLSDTYGIRLRQALQKLSDEVTFWRNYAPIEFELPTGVEEIEQSLSNLRSAISLRLNAKAAAPLEIPAKEAGYDNAIQHWNGLADTIRNCLDQWAQQVAPIIGTIKSDTAVADKNAIGKEIARLDAITLRYSKEFEPLAQQYQTLIQEKTNLEQRRAQKKQELDEYDEQIFKKWEVAINRYLAGFGAGFKFVDAKKNYMGKVPQCSYGIAFDAGTIDVSAKEKPGEPSFKTVMSAGDKSTFALAFFLAQLDQDPNIDQKIIIFDDPFTSLDDFRREFTAKCIVRLASKAAQVIVFSHDKYFLKTCYDHAVTITAVPRQLSLLQNSVHLEEWDIEREVKEGYLQDHMALVEFSRGIVGDAWDMRTKMRPLLEKYIRYRFPNQIPDGQWLGDMIAIIRQDDTHPLRSVLEELEDINDYTAPFHHDPNTPCNEDEVRTHVNRTLAIVGGC